jgi:ParB family transcriptional regulator, chromosome partitioning protein
LLRIVSRAKEIQTVPINDILPSELTSLRIEGETGEEFLELTATIRVNGLLNPLTVRPADLENKYEIVCGNRRYAACKNLGYRDISCIILDLSDREALEYSIVENIQRKGLDPIEEAEAFKRYLVNCGRGSISRLASRIGKSEEYVSHRILLLGLPKEITNSIRRRLLKSSLATELVWMKDTSVQVDLANEILSKNLTLKQTRKATHILKERSLPVKEAVRLVLEEPEEKTVDTEENRLETSRDPWFPYVKDNQVAPEYAICKHAVLILRTCLSGLDMLLDKSENTDVAELLLKQRKSVHTSLDEVINASLNRAR